MHELDEHTPHWSERIKTMNEHELVSWLFVFVKLTTIEARLIYLEGSFVGRRLPDQEVASIQEALRLELQKRTIAKGGRQE